MGDANKTYTLTATSPANSTAAAGSVIANGLDQYDWFTLDVTIQGAAGDTLDIYLQRDMGDGTWRDWIHLPQLAAAAAAASYTIDSKQTEDGLVTVGTGSSPALAAGKFSCTHPGEKVRVWFVPGASTSAGASQVIKLTGWKRRI